MLSVLNPVIESVTQQNLTYTQSADLICSTFETLNTLGAQEKKDFAVWCARNERWQPGRS